MSGADAGDRWDWNREYVASSVFYHDGFEAAARR